MNSPSARSNLSDTPAITPRALWYSGARNGVIGLQRGPFVLHLAPMSGHGRNVVATLEADDADALYDQ
jgi:hypothetical protein